MIMQCDGSRHYEVSCMGSPSPRVYDGVDPTCLAFASPDEVDAIDMHDCA